MTQLYAEQLASNQLAHVTWLRQQLGPLAMPSPAIDISSPFAAIADLAVGKPAPSLRACLPPASWLSQHSQRHQTYWAASDGCHADSIVYPPFTPYADPLSFVLGAYLLEPVGASAYLGVLPALAGNSSLQAAFSGFFGVEVCPLRDACPSRGPDPCLMGCAAQAAHAGAASAYVLQQASALLPSTNVTVADFTGLLAAFLDDGTPDAQGIITQQKGTEEANLVRSPQECRCGPALRRTCLSRAPMPAVYGHPTAYMPQMTDACDAGASQQQRHAVWPRS